VILRFEDCELDVGRVVFRREGRELHIEPQAFNVLSYLIERRGEVVRKVELLDRVWGDRFVSEAALTTQIKSVRQAVGDDGILQRVIRTVHGKGYEFVAEVRVVEESAAPDGAPGEPVAAVSRLPAPVQPLIGRDAVLDLLVGKMATSRLVTLVGTGGVGKTSVGYELARRVAANYTDGVYVVELVTVVDEGATFEAFATALDVSTRQRLSVEDAIVDMLRPRSALLLLDNCEHLIELVADLVSRILRAAPAVSIVATSREPLAVSGEQVWTIEPLPTDGGAGVTSFDVASVPAVALFVERARAADPGFELDPRTAPAVMEICRRLDGIPLAIELAASRARAIDVLEIALRLDERFRLLKAVRRGTDPRHRTLHDAISWSYELLGDDEQRLFAALAVFAGPFDLGAAEAVCSGGDVLDLLTRLTERSMLAVRRQTGGGTRYEMLETLREYGRQRLDDTRSVELFTAHAEHFVAVARGVEADLTTSAEVRASASAEAAFADLRAAQRFSLQVGDLDAAFRLIGSVREYAMRALRYEVFAWAEAGSTRPEAVGHPLRPLMTGIHAYGAWVRGEYDLAVSLAHRARDEEDPAAAPISGLAERVLANVHYTVGRLDDGMNEAARLIAIAEASGNGSRMAHAYYLCSVATSSSGALEEGRRLAALARAAGSRTGSPTDLASAFVAEGYAADPDDERALEAFDMADRLARSAGNRWMSAFARTEASGILVRRGQLAEACTSLADMVDLWYRSGEWSQQWHTLSRCMMALDRIGQPEIAAEVVGAIDAHATMGAPPSMASLRDLAFETRDSLAAQLGADRTEERRSVGASRPLVATVDRVRSALLGRPLDD
jgi:predicted ATPase/DNA-binding winged helix-turn-helix (wHTH) protein